jgi:PKD domain-containing protein
MLHPLFPNWRLIALALAVSLGSPWAAAARADSPQATVVSPGGASQTLALSALGSGDVAERSYLVRSAAGEETRTVSGFSLAALLEAAGADPYSFSYLEVQRPSGGAVLLSRAQALGGFVAGPPVVYPTEAGTAFLRPSIGSGDDNATDSFEAPQGLTIVLRKGAPLQLRAQASPRRTAPGKPVSFEAILERAGAGEELTYSWYFDDGHSAAGPRASHSFAKPGSYDVVVGARASGEEAGASAVVTIQVGAPASGPDRKGGGTSNERDAPDHGAANGSGDASGGSSGAVPGTATAPSTEAAASTPAATPEPAAAAPKPDRNKPKREATKRQPPPGERISGELLATAATALPARPDAAAAARRGNPQAEEGGGGPSVPAAAWGALMTLGLLGAGALLEARGLATLLPSRRGAS